MHQTDVYRFRVFFLSRRPYSRPHPSSGRNALEIIVGAAVWRETCILLDVRCACVRHRIQTLGVEQEKMLLLRSTTRTIDENSSFCVSHSQSTLSSWLRVPRLNIIRALDSGCWIRNSWHRYVVKHAAQKLMHLRRMYYHKLLASTCMLRTTSSRRLLWSCVTRMWSWKCSLQLAKASCAVVICVPALFDRVRQVRLYYSPLQYPRVLWN